MHSFDPNCTLPPEGTNFVGSAPIRGTLQILWSSLSVLILCTWTLLHLNIPPHTTARTKWQKLRRATTRLFSKFGWMLFNVLAPEWVFTKACLDWISVYQLRTRYAEQAQEDGVPWTPTHTHFANMGGFGISFQDLAQEDQRRDADTDPIATSRPRDQRRGAYTEPTATSNSQEESIPLSAMSKPDSTALKSPEWVAWAQGIDRTMEHSYAMDALNNTKRILSRSISRTQSLQIDSHNSDLILDMTKSQEYKEYFRGADIRDNVCMNLLLLRANLWILDAAQLLEARKLGIIDSLPDIEEDDIEDRSNNNVFIRLLAVGQTSWFILQFLVRFRNGQPNTQLEVMVVAFAVCSIVTYFFLWDRPKEAEYTVFLKAKKYPRSGVDMVKVAAAGPLYWSGTARRSIWISNSQMHHIESFGGQQTPAISAAIMCAIMLVFGAIHCVAWNFDFPTRIEQIMWQASSLTSILAPVLALLTLFIGALYYLENAGIWRTLFNWFAIMLPLFSSPALFVAARLFILVEVFRALVFQPSGAFETTWLGNLPHFG